LDDVAVSYIVRDKKVMNRRRVFLPRRFGGDAASDAVRLRLQNLEAQAKSLLGTMASARTEDQQLDLTIRLSTIEDEIAQAQRQLRQLLAAESQAASIEAQRIERRIKLQQEAEQEAKNKSKVDVKFYIPPVTFPSVSPLPTILPLAKPDVKLDSDAARYQRLIDASDKVSNTWEEHLEALQTKALLEQEPGWENVEAPKGTSFQDRMLKVGVIGQWATRDYFKGRFGHIEPRGCSLTDRQIAEYALTRAEEPDTLRQRYPRMFAYERAVQPPGGPTSPPPSSYGGASTRTHAHTYAHTHARYMPSYPHPIFHRRQPCRQFSFL